MKKFLYISLILIGFWSWGPNQVHAQNRPEASTEQEETVAVHPVKLYFFHIEGCSHCKAEEKFLEKIEDSYPNLEIESFLLDNDEKNQKIFEKVVEMHELSGGVPVTIIGEKAITGFNNDFGTGLKIRKRIEECSETECKSPLEDPAFINSILSSKGNNASVKGNEESRIIQIFNREICLDEGSLCFLGGLLGLADGVNPCMFSVLTFLLVYLMGIGSSKKALKAGIAFIVATFFFYLFFMYGLIKIISVLKIASEIRITIAIFALVAGAIMIKDFFYYGKWFSLEIPKKIKPTLEKLTRKGTVVSAIVLALLSSLVELPCTSGIPLAYVSILSSKDVFVLGYLILYNIFFVLPLLVIVIGTIFVWKKVEKVDEWKEKGKRYMRLIAGLLLVFLSIALWLKWF